VLLGAVGALAPGLSDAVVSLCRLGSAQAPVTPNPHNYVEFWIIDQDDANNDLVAVVRDAAGTVAALRNKDKTVLLHCVQPRPAHPSPPPPMAHWSREPDC
jgi:hypothetical protein